MTRFDIFVRSLILKHLSLSHLELSINQEALLLKMIEETYHNLELLPYSIEDRVTEVVHRHRQTFFSLA